MNRIEWTNLILEVLGHDWKTASGILQEILRRHPEIPNPITAQGLAKPLYILKAKGYIEDNGAEWPELKKWRRRLHPDPIDEVIQAMIELEIVKSREEGLRLLAQREYQREETKYKEIVDKAQNIRAIKEEQRKKLENLNEQRRL